MGSGYVLGDVGGLDGVVWDINLVTSILCSIYVDVFSPQKIIIALAP